MGINPPSRGALTTTTTTTTNTIQMNNTSTTVGIPTDSKCYTLQYFCCPNLNPCNCFAKITHTENAPPRAPLRPCGKPIPCRLQIDVLFEIVAPATRRPHYASPGGSPDHPAPRCNPRGRHRTWDPSGRSRQRAVLICFENHALASARRSFRLSVSRWAPPWFGKIALSPARGAYFL